MHEDFRAALGDIPVIDDEVGIKRKSQKVRIGRKCIGFP